jgi:hypothetical protein
VLTGPFQEIRAPGIFKKRGDAFHRSFTVLQRVLRGDKNHLMTTPTPMRSAIYSIDLIGMRQLRA